MSGNLPSPSPPISPESSPYWEGAAEGRLRLQRCRVCESVIWYPRSICPSCAATSLDWFDASGRGVVYSFTVNHRGTGPYAKVGPYVLAYVELEEGPRVLTNIVDANPDSIHVGQQVTARFDSSADGTAALVRFAPAASADG